MSYLVYQDYKINIQDRVYIQLVQNNDAKRIAAEQWAISIVRGKLTQKYDVNREFTPTLPWNPAATYNVRDRVIIDFPAWVASTTYTSGTSVVIYQGTGYICATTNSDATFTTGHWTAIAPQYTIFYASYPQNCTYEGAVNPATLANPFAPEFSLVDIAAGNTQRLYNIGDVVFWKNSLWTCNIQTTLITDDQLIQYISYKDVPYINVFPDDIINNAQGQFWGNQTPYNIAAGTPLNGEYDAYDPTAAYTVGATVSENGLNYVCIAATATPSGTFDIANWQPAAWVWTMADNRTPEIVECVKDLTIYKLGGLLNFMRNEWTDRYKGSLELLRCYANGYATLLMPIILPLRGARARYGGKVKQQNTY